MNTLVLAAQAVREAMTVRAQNGYGAADSVCPYDLAIKLKIKVSFESVPSLEGVYSPRPTPHIILNSDRPAGRRRYTCGHEIGHHIFKHGFKIDELDESNSSPSSPEEFLAQRFSGALLMPQIAVNNAFTRRGWASTTATAEQYFIIAQELGVGFTTLLMNTEINLKGISKMHADSLRRSTASSIRKSIAGSAVSGDLFFIDQYWLRPTIDVEIGDLIILPDGGSIHSSCVSPESGSGQRFKAIAQGSAKVEITSSGKTFTLRVSRHGFVGNARYRHLKEENENV